jgi:VWFA-related protein
LLDGFYGWQKRRRQWERRCGIRASGLRVKWRVRISLAGEGVPLTPCRTFSRAVRSHRSTHHTFHSLRPSLRVAFVLLVLGAGSVAFGQGNSGSPAPASMQQVAPGETRAANPASVTADRPSRYVLLDVAATDIQGRRVAGLAENDFRVIEKIDWVNQVPEKIASFQAINQKNKISLRSSAETGELLSTPPQAHGDPIAAREPAEPLTILLLDDLNTDLFAPSFREQVASMADLNCEGASLDPLCVTAPVAVLRLGPKLELLQDFSPYRTDLQSTLHSAFAEKPSESSQAKYAGATPVAAAESSGLAGSLSSLPPIRDWNRLPRGGSDPGRRAQLTMDAIRAIARHLAGYPGRKRLIWISSSFPFSIAPDPRTNRSDDPMSFRGQAAVVMNALASARVSVYPARPGLVPKRKKNDDSHPPRPSALAAAAAAVSVTPAQASAEYFAATAPMEEFAAETGGEACIDDRDLSDCFNRLLRDGVSDYLIAYSPSAENWKEGFHRIIVTTPDRGVHLSFRQYYYVPDKKAAAGPDMELKQAACDDLMTATALKLTAEVQSSALEKARFSLAVNGQSLTADSSPDHSRQLRLHLDFAVCTFDARGKALQHVQFPTRQDMSAEEFTSVQQAGIRRLVEFQPAPGTALLRWVVRDSLSGDLGSVDVVYQAPPAVFVAGTIPETVAGTIADTVPDTVADTVPDNGKTDHPASEHTSSSSAEPTGRAKQGAPSEQLDSTDADLPTLETDSEIKPYCAAIAGASEHSAALAELCRFALSMPRNMPNVICDLETRRFWRAYNIANRDVVTATVTYANGQENYSNIQINGGAANARTLNSSWSTGEFASILQMVFSPASDASFRFSKEARLNSTPALVFEFQVDQSSNLLYYLHAFYSSGWGVTLFPGYRGKVWLNKSNFQLMRLEKGASHMPASFPITHASTVIDYSNVPLGDGSDFVLPGESEIETCSSEEGAECAHNVVRFKNWHKFRAKTRILTTEEPH